MPAHAPARIDRAERRPLCPTSVPSPAPPTAARPAPPAPMAPAASPAPAAPAPPRKVKIGRHRALWSTTNPVPTRETAHSNPRGPRAKTCETVHSPAATRRPTPGADGSSPPAPLPAPRSPRSPRSLWRGSGPAPPSATGRRSPGYSYRSTSSGRTRTAPQATSVAVSRATATTRAIRPSVVTALTPRVTSLTRPKM